MRVVGIVAEYNPFHNGHFFHIQESKKISRSDCCVCVISGNFMQRGEPSIVDKWSRAYMALCCGADLVIELPTVYSVSSAENFANGAVKILNSLNIVDDISFGSECGNMQILDDIAKVTYEEPKKYKNILEHELKKGISYPKARENALMMYLNDVEKYANVLTNPNNVLAIEYLKALKSTKSKIRPLTVQREKVSYNEEKRVGKFASATAIRKFINEKTYSEMRECVPRSTYQILGEEMKKGHTVLGLKKFEKEIIYLLRRMSVEEISRLPDVSEGLEFAIKKSADKSNTIEELIENIKSKRYTQTRIQRILVYTLLNITAKEMEESKKVNPYIRVLGFNNKGRILISEIIKNNPKTNMVTSVNKYMQENIKKGSNKNLVKMLNKDIFATNVYTLGYENESNSNLDYTHNMIIIK